MPTLGDVGSSCPLCGGSLKYSKKLDLQSEVDSYTELLKHVKPSELLPEGHLNWKAWAHAESCDSEAVLKGPADGWKPLAIVKVVNPGTEVCRICYRADIQGTVAAWEGHDRADVTVLETLPRYWTLVAEAARQSCPSMQVTATFGCFGSN